MPQTVSPAEIHRVLEVPIDRLCVVADSEQDLEVRIPRCDRSHVLSAVEPPRLVALVSVEADGDDSRAKAVGKLVVVVPTEESALVLSPVGAESLQRHELGLSVWADVDDTNSAGL